MEFTLEEQVQHAMGALIQRGWYDVKSYTIADVAQAMHEDGKRPPYGEQWDEDSLRNFAAEHNFSRDPLENLPSLVVTVDEPGLFEMAHPNYASFLSVHDGMKSARIISRYIEKGNPENRDRLWKAIEEDPEVRSEVLRFAPMMLDHPWAAEHYQRFLEHAERVDSETSLVTGQL